MLPVSISNYSLYNKQAYFPNTIFLKKSRARLSYLVINSKESSFIDTTFCHENGAKLFILPKIFMFKILDMIYNTKGLRKPRPSCDSGSVCNTQVRSS